MRNSLPATAGGLNVSRSLTRLLELGLLTDEPCPRGDVRQTDGLGIAPPGIEWFTVPTRNRPDFLIRALESYLQNFASFGRRPKLLISDDSDSPNLLEQNTVALAHLAENTDLEIYYCNRACREELAAAIARRSGVPIEIVRRACCNSGLEPHRYGANRNTLLLCTAGSVILSVDDDTVCRAAEPTYDSGLASHLALTGDVDVTSIALFSEEGRLQAAVSERENDVLGCHEAILGYLLTDYLQRLSSGTCFDTQHMCSHLADALRQRQGRISVTFNGQWGTLAVDNLAQLMMTRPIPVQGPPGLGGKAGVSLPGLRFSPTPAICHGGFCMSTFIGIDNRVVLAPFPAQFRNEDGIFGTLLSACSPAVFMAHVPLCLLHDPRDRRPLGQAFCVRFSDVVVRLIGSFAKLSATDGTEQNLAAAGHQLYALGTLGTQAYRDLTGEVVWQFVQSLVRQHESVVAQNESGATPPASEEWLDGLTRALVRSHPAELIQEKGIQTLGGEEQQQYLRSLGELCIHWPAMFEGAKLLRSDDHPIWRRIAAG